MGGCDGNNPVATVLFVGFDTADVVVVVVVDFVAVDFSEGQGPKNSMELNDNLETLEKPNTRRPSLKIKIGGIVTYLINYVNFVVEQSILNSKIKLEKCGEKSSVSASRIRTHLKVPYCDDFLFEFSCFEFDLCRFYSYSKGVKLKVIYSLGNISNCERNLELNISRITCWSPLLCLGIESSLRLYKATGLLLVKCFDNKTGLGVFSLVILSLTRPLVPNPQKKKKKKCI